MRLEGSRLDTSNLRHCERDCDEAIQILLGVKVCDCFVALLLAMTGRASPILRNLAPAPAPNAGIRLTAMTTAKVITSMAMPSTEIAARSPLSLRS